MFNRPLALKLLAPTVVVSLTLVGACIYAALYLNQLHVNLLKELTENIESTRADQRLESAAAELVMLLRAQHGDPQQLAALVSLLNQRAADGLEDARALANLDREQILVSDITSGFDEYLKGWQKRSQVPAAKIRSYDAALADNLDRNVLRPCKNLRDYNLNQIEVSNLKNQDIIRQLYWGLVAVGLGAPVGGLVLGYAVARSLHRSIYQLSVGIRDAAGRLNRELGQVTFQEKGDLPDLHRQLEGVVAEIERVVEQLQQREREVLRAEQMAAVGQVAAGVAHELRNPLTSVKMLVQTGLEGDAAGLPADDLAIMEKEIRRMEQCIQMFLDFARPPRSERRQAELGAVLERSLALIEGRAHRQKVKIIPLLPADPVRLFIDPEQIHQVVVNLLLNALDALPGGGAITLAVDVPDIELDGKSVPVARVQVRDTGAGIAPRIHERLFEPFVSSKETGVGLGLSISKRLIEAHGGTIAGANAPGGGAVFTFTLPLPEAVAGVPLPGPRSRAVLPAG